MKRSTTKHKVKVSGAGVVYADPKDIVSSKEGKRQLENLRKFKISRRGGQRKLKTA